MCNKQSGLVSVLKFEVPGAVVCAGDTGTGINVSYNRTDEPARPQFRMYMETEYYDAVYALVNLSTLLIVTQRSTKMEFSPEEVRLALALGSLDDHIDPTGIRISFTEIASGVTFVLEADGTAVALVDGDELARLTKEEIAEMNLPKAEVGAFEEAAYALESHFTQLERDGTVSNQIAARVVDAYISSPVL